MASDGGGGNVSDDWVMLVLGSDWSDMCNAWFCFDGGGGGGAVWMGTGFNRWMCVVSFGRMSVCKLEHNLHTHQLNYIMNKPVAAFHP